MAKRTITPDLTTKEILTEWPETIPVFLAHGMSCVGCLMSTFDTLEEALIVHRLQVVDVVRELNQCLEDAKSHEVNHDPD
jgi:hybrid cluster-associated redox disulfide protein